MGTKYDIQCPVFAESGKMFVTSPYGERVHPVTKKKTFHKGIDLVRHKVVSCAATILSFDDGTVTKVVTNVKGKDTKNTKNAAGNYVIVKHRNGYVTKYLHLKYGTIAVKQGEAVKAGTKVGYMGTTGNSTGVHLHFQIELNGKTVDPLPFLLGEKTFDIEKETCTVELSILKKGSKSDEVKTLQALLNAWNKAGLTADGNFGANTEKALKAYQKANGLTADGVCGQTTWSKLLKNK